ncbi:GTP cyclohydrolase II [Pseudomonas cichorii]|uniref:GTP cyclohydrolase II n=1 Tax=Pseudomonas cichorii TaxID=36746 RepID=UPI001C8A1333|nr:GTP cyclohydrolase II [Pseudomonas cichorii]MBX8487624.1 GTP cyclohydrolase II [Pseudomonas cichorii]MBX8496959.1 GTP cyclohydrolase II [Pseudomonas cichorii]MBX8516895.1 GTP cyclohydrolase II [Pseudomonas cichorii]MBX8531627.1 GTP cyclohydrolase II [Pseudomonas cichorii]MBX8576819.1 GTP cyclohydrolase II [Pseudomonas cichorii]
MKTVKVRNKVDIPLNEGQCPGTFFTFSGLDPKHEHILIKLGPDRPESPLVRIHSECLTGDVFSSQRCDCGPQLTESINRMHKEGGYLIYLRQEGRGIGLYAKLEAYRLQDTGLDTFEANTHLSFPEDDRDFSLAASMLKAVGITDCRIITNNPEKVSALESNGIHVSDVIPTGVFITEHNRNYLQAKIDKKQHSIALSN